eukprot:scaffold140188_cov33-Prasinocladus_malaysianus.AAC.3
MREGPRASERNTSWRDGGIVHTFDEKPIPIPKYDAPPLPGFYVLYDQCTNQTKIGIARDLRARLLGYSKYWPRGVVRFIQIWPQRVYVNGRDGKVRKLEQEVERLIKDEMRELFPHKSDRSEYFRGRPTLAMQAVIGALSDWRIRGRGDTEAIQKHHAWRSARVKAKGYKKGMYLAMHTGRELKDISKETESIIREAGRGITKAKRQTKREY